MSPATERPLCAFCRRHAVDPAWKPFCSERCKLHDLARWADGSYRIASTPDEEPDEAGEADDDDSSF